MVTVTGNLDLPFLIRRERLAEGRLRASEICEEVISRVRPYRSDRPGLAWMDEDFARRVALSRDNYRKQGRPLGALHGVPVLVDDSFDMARVPMSRGLEALEGALSERDATAVARLRADGAQLFAKSAIPTLRIGEGTDAAPEIVGAGAFPLGLSIDARGEVLRAASKAGAVAYRPSAGLVPKSGVLDISPSLDNVTLLARELSGLAYLTDALTGYDAADAASEPRPSPKLGSAIEGPPRMPPVIGFLNDSRATARAAVDELVAVLGDKAFATDTPALFEEASAQSERIVRVEGAKCLKPFERRFGDRLPDDIGRWISEGEAISGVDYLRALDWIPVLRSGMNEMFERCTLTAMLGPIEGEAATAPAEVLAAFLGLPVLTLPLLQSPDGMPLGVTLIARRGEDARLFQTATWLTTTLNGDE